MPFCRPLSCVLILVLASCGGGGSGNTGTDQGLTNSTAPNTIFKAVTENDISHIQTLWTQRDLSVKELSLVYEDTQPTYYLRIYQHKVGSNIHYGAVITPSATLTKSLPVNVFNDGLDQSNPSIDVSNLTRNYKSDSVLLVPAYRGRYLRYKDQNHYAQGDFCDAYDGAADDAIAFMNVVEATTPMAKMDKVLTTGYSRGGNVALLLAERDKRIDTVIAGAGPVDFYRQEVRDRYASQYECQFLAGKTTDEARLKMLASSPIHFKLLPSVRKVYLFQGGSDNIVPRWNSDIMNQHLINQKVDVSFYLYEGYGHSDIWQNQNFTNTWSQLPVEFVASH